MFNSDIESRKPELAGKTVETKKGQRVVRVSYDSFGREVSRRNDQGYWSSREYEQHEDNGEVVHYKNSDKRWWRKHYSANGKLLIVEDVTGEWFVINDSSHLVFYHPQSGLYRIGTVVGDESEIREHLCAPGKRYCPSILAAIASVEWKKRNARKKKNRLATICARMKRFIFGR